MTNKGHISKLFLFSKDTDAPHVIKGFKYQELKTLEVWLFNKVHGIDERIYCDFEEDIFLRDLKEFKSTFKQLKLYSSKNFSFSSQEIKKSIIHFFMLFVKGEYLLDEPLFIFETNTSVAAKRGDNDAELLKEWSNNQDDISDKLLQKCVDKLKLIVDEYIADQYSALKNEKNQHDIVIAKDIYEDIPRETWELFTKSIKWFFGGISSEEAIDISIQSSMTLISQLPFPISQNDYTKVFDRLKGIVGDKSIEESPEDRFLTNELLDKQLLNLGDKDDNVYGLSFELWKDVTEINYFNIGEFYQVLFAAKHCRRNKYLESHSAIWINLLFKYVSNPDIIKRLRREAIYEVVWLTLRPTVTQPIQNSLEGLEDLVLEYFSDFEKYDDKFSVEDALNLMVVIGTSHKFGLISIEEKQIKEWFVRFEKFIKSLKASSIDKNTYCHFLELEGFFYLNKNSFGYGEKNLDLALAVLEEIIIELPNAALYPVSQLGKRIDGIVDLSIQFDLNDEMLPLEDYSEKLLPYIKEREGGFSAAKRYTERGVKLLHSKNPKGILKALDFFHKAKDLYFNEATYEGFVLAVLGISQLYAAIGMNLAAKYYSLSAIWFCINNGGSQLYKRISDSHALLMHADFKQGSWMSALLDFENYISTRTEFDPKEFDPLTDELLGKTLSEGIFILALTPLISNQLTGFIDYEKNRMGNLYPEFIKEGVEFIEKEQSEIGLPKLVARKLENPPICDIGKTRTISWKAFGSTWNIEFENDFIHSSVGEEFSSLIQIIQSDISLSGIDLHLTRGTIKIQIDIVEKPKASEQLPSNSEYLWKVYLSILSSKEYADKNMHYAAITVTFQMILNELSVLQNEKFNELFLSLFEKGLSNKVLTINAYQRAYRDIYSEEKFNVSMRNKFNSEELEIDQYESALFALKKKESPLYEHEKSIKNIKGRYTNCLKTTHLTLNRLKNSIEFNTEIDKLKMDGWLDWQILLALSNNILDLKAKNMLQQNGKSYSNDEEWLDDFQKVFQEILHKDEKETYVIIPVNEIIGENLNFQLQHGCIHVLGSYGLENKSRFPNSQAIKELLINRFRFNKDEIIEMSPFRNKKET